MTLVKIPVVGFGANCWLVIDNETKEAVIIDPSPDCETIFSIIEKRHSELKYILLTHAHFDHMLSLEELRQKSKAPCCVHADDEEYFYDGNKNAYTTFFHRDMSYSKPEIILHDGDTLSFGNTSISVLHTPGHTKGSCCFICENSLFTGDTLFDCGMGRCDLYGGSESAIKDSLKRLKALQKNYKIYPGHGSITSLDKQKEFNPYFGLL